MDANICHELNCQVGLDEILCHFVTVSLGLKLKENDRGSKASLYPMRHLVSLFAKSRKLAKCVLGIARYSKLQNSCTRLGRSYAHSIIVVIWQVDYVTVRSAIAAYDHYCIETLSI